MKGRLRRLERAQASHRRAVAAAFLYVLAYGAVALWAEGNTRRGEDERLRAGLAALRARQAFVEARHEEALVALALAVTNLHTEEEP